MVKKVTALFVIVVATLGCSSIAVHKETIPEGDTVRLLTFNIWGYGKGSKLPPARMAEVIKASNADIVGLQENRKNGKAIADILGWHYVKQGRSATILSRLEVIETTEKKHGVKIRLDTGQEVFLFNVHFLPSPYQPYQLLNIPYGRAPFIKTEAEAVAAAKKVHGGHLESLLKEIDAVQDEGIPILITGDFNEPSHLDWTEATARSGRHPIKVSYPSSLALAKAGFSDAYRTVHPDVMKMPGYTWTPVTKTSDPRDHHDRIDIIYFRGKGVRTNSVEIVGENRKNADIAVNPYPSDHRAVVATFTIPKQTGTKKHPAGKPTAGDGTKGAVVSVLSDAKVGPAVRHGLGKLSEALRAKGIELKQGATGDIVIVAAVAGKTGPAAEMHKTLNAKMPGGAETLRIKTAAWKGKDVLLVSGGDDRGLMYALLDVADRIGWAKDAKRPLSEVRDADEAPAVAERALSKYTMHRRCFESYFHDEAYWTRYLDMLARNRFNTLALLFGYENGGYFAPPYPYFFNVEGFDGVGVVGITAAEQKRNLESLNKLIRMTHARGLNFTLGIWDHIYRGGVQGPTADAKKRTKGLVWGVTARNLVPYTKAALTQLLKKVHNLDAIQFRMHGESGLSRKEMAEFWPDIYKIMLRHGPGIRFDARAKNFPHDLIDRAVADGVPIRMCTKYWMEQMGLPFHPTHVNPRNQRDRRHGYADMLRYPRQYKMHWRVWNGGTTRVLLWGDPEYVRRFAGSTHLYDGDGFEVNEPMATKMQDHPHDKAPFDLLTKNYRYYDWEFERYWHFFQVFGRVGYNPKTPPEVWSREFERRFGPDAGPLVQKALHRASGILPRIVACSYPYNHFPTTRGWAEMQRQGDIDAYSRSLPSDTQQFLSMTQAAKNRATGGESAKIHPERSSRWFARAAKDVLDLATQAEKNISGHENKEFTSTIADLRILAGLAQYHSHRLLSGLNWALFKQTNNATAMDDAIAHETNAAKAWKSIVTAAGDIYHNDLMMGRRGSRLAGHWKGELARIEKGLAAMIEQRKNFKPKPASITPIIPVTVTDDTIAPAVTHKPIAGAPADKPLTITAEVRDASGVKWVRLRYRSVTQFEDYRTLEMKPTGEKDQYRCTVPGEHIPARWDFMYLIEVMDRRGNGTIYPDLNNRTPYIVVRLKR